MTGCFINTLVLCTDAQQDVTFAAYLKRVRDTVLAAQANQDVPFERLVEAVQPQRNLGYSPLFQVLFDVHRDRILQQPAMGGLTFADAPESPCPTTHFDLMVGIGEREEGLRASFVYCTDLFDAEVIARLARAYVRVLEIITAAPDTAIASLAAEVMPPAAAHAATATDKPAVQVLKAMQEVLGGTVIDPRTSFFAQGGTSLAAVALVQRLNRHWAVDIPLHLIFLHQVVADFIEAIEPYARKGA